MISQTVDAAVTAADLVLADYSEYFAVGHFGRLDHAALQSFEVGVEPDVD